MSKYFRCLNDSDGDGNCPACMRDLEASCLVPVYGSKWRTYEGTNNILTVEWVFPRQNRVWVKTVNGKGFYTSLGNFRSGYYLPIGIELSSERAKVKVKPYVWRKDRKLYWGFPWVACDGYNVGAFESWEKAMTFALRRYV